MHQRTRPFAMDMPRFDMPVEPLFPRERCKWLQSRKRTTEYTYTHCTLPTYTHSTQELLSASTGDVCLGSEAKRRCDLWPWKYAERGCWSVVAIDWRESGLGRSLHTLSVRTGCCTVREHPPPRIEAVSLVLSRGHLAERPRWRTSFRASPSLL